MLFFTMPTQQTQMPERWEWLLSHVDNQMHAALWNEALRIVKSVEDAQDVLQESYIRGAKNCWQLQDENRIFQWMFTIVRREAYRFKNKFSLAAIVCDFELLAHVVSTQATPDDYIVHQDELEQLNTLLKGLDELDQKILMLKKSTGAELKDIAKMLNLNYNTVKSRYRRAIQHLRTLAKEGEHNED